MADTDSTLEVQKAIVSAMRLDPALIELVDGRVYDEPEDEVTLPYISISHAYGQPAVETLSDEGWESSIQIDIWSRKPGHVEVHRIAKAIVDLLNNAEPALETKTVVMMRTNDYRTMKDPDGRTTHGLIRLQVITN